MVNPPTSFRLSSEGRENIRKLAARLMVSQTEAIELAVESTLRKDEKEKSHIAHLERLNEVLELQLQELQQKELEKRGLD